MLLPEPERPVMTARRALPEGGFSAALKLGLEFARKLPGGMMALKLQHVVAGRDLHQDADVASQGDGHANVRAGSIENLIKRLVQAQPVVSLAVAPVLQLDDQVDGRPLAYRGETEEILNVDDADSPQLHMVPQGALAVAHQLAVGV